MKKLYPITITYEDGKSHTLGLWLRDDQVASPIKMAELVFRGSTTPFDLKPSDPAVQVHELFRELRLRSVANGDTVTFQDRTVRIAQDGFHEVTVA